MCCPTVKLNWTWATGHCIFPLFHSCLLLAVWYSTLMNTENVEMLTFLSEGFPRLSLHCPGNKVLFSSALERHIHCGKGHIWSAECPGEVTLVFPKWTSVRVMVRAEDRWTCAPCCICLWDLKTWTWLLFKHAILVWLCQKGVKFEDMPFYMSGTHLNGGGGGGASFWF